MTPTPANAFSDLGECNMGDPDTLRDFVDWAMTEFPADKYALILWNHGDGWKSINNWVPWADDTKDAKDAGLSRGICVDNTNNDYLSLQETEVALTDKYVQLLGYDACLMHMIEVVYQVRANAGVSVGSEEPEPGDGWPYHTILNDLTGTTPAMNEYTLATVIVDRIAKFSYSS
jgi:clostripain